MSTSMADIRVAATGAILPGLPFKKLSPHATLPVRKHDNDAAVDLYSAEIERIELFPHQQIAFSTGLALAIPVGYYGQVASRSGLAIQGVHSLGGVIDSGYRGEVKVVLTNSSQIVIVVEPFARIAQLIILPIYQPVPVEVQELPEAGDARGAAGFGSTGIR